MANGEIRPIRIDGQLAFITLTKGYTATIDAADAPLVEGANWYAQVKRRTVYAVRSDRSGPKLRQMQMHRVIMGDPQGMDVDHRDSNGLNNQRANLRIATASQNAQNRRVYTPSASGLKGVTWHKRSKKWQAQIGINRKNIFIGSFDTAEDAHAAYAAATERHCGEFARL